MKYKLIEKVSMIEALQALEKGKTVGCTYGSGIFWVYKKFWWGPHKNFIVTIQADGSDFRSIDVSNEAGLVYDCKNKTYIIIEDDACLFDNWEELKFDNNETEL